MATDTDTAELLDESILTGDIPCQVTMYERTCGRPSVARVKNLCHCGDRHIVFICGECLEMLKAHKVACNYCGCVVTAFHIL